jgi:hypothetical protein
MKRNVKKKYKQIDRETKWFFLWQSGKRKKDNEKDKKINKTKRNT